MPGVLPASRGAVWIRTRARLCDHGSVTTPDHDFLGWAPDDYPPSAWDTTNLWAQPPLTDPTPTAPAAAAPLTEPPAPPSRPARTTAPAPRPLATSRPSVTALGPSVPEPVPSTRATLRRIGSGRSGGALVRGGFLAVALLVFGSGLFGGEGGQWWPFLFVVVAVAIVAALLLRAVRGGS